MSVSFLDKMLNPHTIQLATAFLLNYGQFSFLSSSDTATPLSKVCTFYGWWGVFDLCKIRMYVEISQR